MTNALTLTAYDLADAIVNNSELDQAQNIEFTTGYPGGRYLDLKFFLPRDVVKSWAVQPNYKIVARNGQKIVWEGRVTTPALTLDETTQGCQVTCTGPWANYMMARKTRKPWALTSLGEEVWKNPTAAFNAGDKSLEDMWEFPSDKGFLRWVPKPDVAFASGQYSRKIYTAPSGTTVKRVTGKYNLQEDGQQWAQGIYDQTNAVYPLNVTTSGAATFDVTLATPASVIWLTFYAAANQTATNFNTLHGDFEYVTIYTETGTIDLQQIAIDIAGYIPELSTDISKIAATSLELVPWAAENGYESYASMLTRAASCGDGSTNNPWAVYIGASDESADGKPLLVVEAIPDLTDYDYAVRLNDPNLAAPFTAEQDITQLHNYITVEYQDQNNNSVVISPADDATLTDAVSVAAYGRREPDSILSIQTTSATIAASYGRAYLAMHKDPQWTVSGGITVQGYIRAKGGGKVPACEILPGKRIKIENFLNDISGSGLTLLITGTSYNDDSLTSQLTVGRSSRLDVWLARILRSAAK